LIAGAAVLALGALPFFHLMQATEPMHAFLGEVGFVLGVGVMSGGLVANAELIPADVRCTGLAFAYNTSIGLFGGTTPMLAAWLITVSGNPIAPAYWIALAGFISLVTAVFLIRETRFEPLASVAQG
jgi:MHS family proline/betaine transporter-like MFS transporter